MTTTTTLTDLLAHPELCALRAAICADPAEDTPRLVLADWREERGEREWSELIRVQMQLAKWDCTFKQCKEQPGWKHFCGTDSNGYWLCQPLRMRADAILGLDGNRALLEPTLRRGVRCGECGGSKQRLEDADGTGRRVWLDCPTCHGTGWMGTLGMEKDTRCRRCEGTGYHRYPDFPDGRPNYSDSAPCGVCLGTGFGGEWLIPARWSRGFVSGITCTLEWWMRNGKRCRAEWPITEIECSDRVPMNEPENSDNWAYTFEIPSLLDNYPGAIPIAIWTRMYGSNGEKGMHPTATAAREALSEAMLAWARAGE